MAQETVVIHHIARFLPYIGGARRILVFVNHETSKKRLARHGRTHFVCAWFTVGKDTVRLVREAWPNFSLLLS
jgi:hypothetical protein